MSSESETQEAARVRCTDCGAEIAGEDVHFVCVTRGCEYVRDAVLCDDCFRKELTRP